MGSELKERIERERLGNIRLAGLLHAEELKRHYQQADIFLFPSTWEGSPKVLLEAAACGLPVIARNNYQPETVVEGESGYLVGSDAELFARLGELLGSPEQRRKFGEAGRKHSQKFDWGPIARRWEEVFLDLMSRKTALPCRMTAADSRIQKLVTPREPLHVLTLTPFYPVRGDDAQGCFVAEPLAELARLGVANTVRAVQPFYRGGAAGQRLCCGGARGAFFFHSRRPWFVQCGGLSFLPGCFPRFGACTVQNPYT